MSIQEVTAVTPQNLAIFRDRLIAKSDGELHALAAHSDNAAGVAAAIILSERRAENAEQVAALSKQRHEELLRKIEQPHWTAAPGFWVTVIAAVAAVVAAWPVVKPQAPQSSAPESKPIAATSQAHLASAVVPQTPASSQVQQPRSPTSQSPGPRK